MADFNGHIFLNRLAFPNPQVVDRDNGATSDATRVRAGMLMKRNSSGEYVPCSDTDADGRLELWACDMLSGGTTGDINRRHIGVDDYLVNGGPTLGIRLNPGYRLLMRASNATYAEGAALSNGPSGVVEAASGASAYIIGYVAEATTVTSTSPFVKMNVIAAQKNS